MDNSRSLLVEALCRIGLLFGHWEIARALKKTPVWRLSASQLQMHQANSNFLYYLARWTSRLTVTLDDLQNCRQSARVKQPLQLASQIRKEPLRHTLTLNALNHSLSRRLCLCLCPRRQQPLHSPNVASDAICCQTTAVDLIFSGTSRAWCSS